MADIRRVLTEHTRPFAVPDHLEELVGPEDGVISLPLHVYWGPDASVDLGAFSGIRKAYEAVLREGLIDDVRAIISASVLRREWKRLLLPVRIASAWESRFPDLAA